MPRAEHLKEVTLRRTIGLSKPTIFWCEGGWHIQKHPVWTCSNPSESQRAFDALMEERNVSAWMWTRAHTSKAR